MAQGTSLTRVIGIKPTTVGALQGTFFALLGLVTAVSYTISASVEFTESTESILRGLTLGFAHGFVAIILVPVIYFAVGWVIGFIYGYVLNTIIRSSGGLVIETVAEPKK